MPQLRTNAQEHPYASDAKWGQGLKFVIQPVMAKHPDQPDKWTVSGIGREFASKDDAERVRTHLKNNPGPKVKQALAQGQDVDKLLPGALRKLPRWDDVHGIKSGGSGSFEGVQIYSFPVIIEALDAAIDALQEGSAESLKSAKGAFASVLVIQQLLDDYPAKSLGWIPSIRWDGPRRIPLQDIDFSKRDTWRASHEDITPFVRRISKGKMKPIILVKTPSRTKYMIVDGHHRALGYEQLGQDAVAFTATVDRDKGPWDELHAAQKQGSSRDMLGRSGSVSIGRPSSRVA